MIEGWAGAVLVVAAGAGVGWALAGGLASRPRELAELQSGLTLLETEIGYGLIPMPAALARAATAGGLAGRLFGSAAAEMRGGLLPQPALAAAVARADPQSALRPEDWQPLLGLAGVLGGSDAQDQIRHLRLCRERLAAAERMAEQQRLQGEKVYRYMGLLIGLAVAIVLL